jgi:pimeloyl-ACP methyl ester carboxylesterase
MGKSVLVVAVRGWTTSGELLLRGRPGGELGAEFVNSLAAGLPDTDVWAPELDLSMFSMRSAESLSQELFDKISKRVDASPNIETIVLLGYSSGSLLARRVFCMAHGAAIDGTVRQRPVSWADKIDRVVMLAGITRGWEFSSASPPHVRFLAPILLRLTTVVGWFKRTGMTQIESTLPLIWQLKRGSPFVVSTRIQYINVFETLRKRPKSERASKLRVDGLPSTVFLLGAKDEYMSPADCTELGPRIEFAFVELEGSNHSEAVQISDHSPVAIERRRRLVASIVSDLNSLNREPWAVPAGDIDDYLDPMDVAESGTEASAECAHVEHAVMVVHGIRDNGFWTKRIAREIKTLGRTSGIKVRAPTPTYGYFSMWDFVKPGGREQAALWFMERYADVRSHFPNAEISFVGHSNGTYIAARALELCPAIRFHNVVFAGSVVRRDFRWARFPGRVHAVLNYVGTGDGVVAFLPAVFEFLRIRWLDVGGAGAFGFREAEPPPAAAKRLLGTQDQDIELSEIRFVQGGHGAAITEQFWLEIARFILLDALPARSPVARAERIQLLFRCAPGVTAMGVTLAAIVLTSPLSVAAVVASLVAANGTSSGPAMVAAVSAVAASLFVSWLAGRFLRVW